MAVTGARHDATMGHAASTRVLKEGILACFQQYVLTEISPWFLRGTPALHISRTDSDHRAGYPAQTTGDASAKGASSRRSELKAGLIHHSKGPREPPRLRAPNPTNRLADHMRWLKRDVVEQTVGFDVK